MLSWLCLLVRFCTLKRQPHFRTRPGTASPPSVASLSTTILTFHEICSWFSICSIAFLLGFLTAVIFDAPLRLLGRVFVIVPKVSPRYVLGLILPASQTCLLPTEIKSMKQTTRWSLSQWASYLALHVSKRKSFLFLMMPEDFGGHRVSGPASPRDLEDPRNIDGVNEAVRGATFLCRFASSMCPSTCSYERDVRVCVFNSATSRIFLLVFGHTSFMPSVETLTQFPLGIGVWS